MKSVWKHNLNRVRTSILSLQGVAWLLLAIVFSGILYTPLMGDDLPMFQIRVDNPELHSASIHQMAQVLVKQFLPMGRLTVLSFYYTEWVFKVFSAVWLYKSWLMVLNFLTVLLFLKWLKIIGFKFQSALLILCIAAGVQFRLNYHDAYSSYMGLCQIFNGLVFIASGSWVVAYRTTHPWAVILAITASLALVFISEFALILLPLVPLLYWISDQLHADNLQGNFVIRWKRMALWTVPIAAISLIYLLTIVWLRNQYANSSMYSGLTSNLDPFAMLVLEIKQLYAAVPFSNLTNTPRIPIRLLHQLTFWDIAIATFVIVACTVFLLRTFNQQKKSTSHLPFQLNNRPFQNSHQPSNDDTPTSKNHNSSLNNHQPQSDMLSARSIRLGKILGLFLWISTAVFILPSAKYQSELTWGNGYLSLLTQNLGMSLMLYGLLQWSFQSTHRAFLSKSVQVFVGLAIPIAFLFNHSLSKKYKYKKAYPAKVLWEFIRNKQLDILPDSSVLVMQHDFYYRSPELYQQLINHHSRPTITVIDYEGDVLANSNNQPLKRLNNLENRTYGLFVEYQPQIRIQLFPISAEDLRRGELKPTGPLLREIKTANPISVISADMD